MLRPCPWGKVKCQHRRVLTIGQLARYAGVTTKAVRVYHARGLLPEPPRDASGYRRYTARDAVAVLRIRTLADAGVPLARIRALQSAAPGELERALDGVDADLAARIERLQEARRRLRRLAAGEQPVVPAEVTEHLTGLAGLGFSARWVRLVEDLWLLVFATRPDVAGDLFRDQAQAMSDPVLRAIFLDYDRAHDLEPDDPRVDDLAARMVAATRSRYGGQGLPSQDPGPPGPDAGSQVPALIQAAVDADSAAWLRIDRLVRAALRE